MREKVTNPSRRKGLSWIEANQLRFGGESAPTNDGWWVASPQDGTHAKFSLYSSITYRLKMPSSRLSGLIRRRSRRHARKLVGQYGWVCVRTH